MPSSPRRLFLERPTLFVRIAVIVLRTGVPSAGPYAQRSMCSSVALLCSFSEQSQASASSHKWEAYRRRRFCRFSRRERRAYIIETQSRRTSGSSMIRSEVAEVSKLIGFMLRLPHNLNQMSCWILGLSRQSKSARRSQSARRASRGVGRLSGSPTRSWRRMMPGSSTEAAMCKTQPSTRLVGTA